jgi:twinkle protein
MYYDKLSDLGIKLSRRGGSEKTKCPQCSDSRKNKTDKPLSVNITTGEWNCHNCGWKGNVRAHERKRESRNYEKPPSDVLKNIELKSKVTDWFASRGISAATLSKFMIFSKEEFMPQTRQKENCVCFPYFKNGELVNIKFRTGGKDFKMVKDAELIFYNLQSIGDKKFCIITEGEIDCMSVYEAGFGVEQDVTEDGELKNDEFSKWSIVSVPNGASKGNQRMEYLDNCSDWFIGLHEIVVATDNDEAGNMLKDELIRRLGVERCKTINYPLEEVVPTKDGMKRRCKDLNEVLQYLGKEVVCNVIRNAEAIPIDGVYYLEDIFPSMIENFRRGVVLAPTTRFTEMDEYFRWKKGELNLFCGYGNHGKTFFALQLMLTKSIWDGWRWAIFSPENFPANDFYDDLVEMYVGKWLNEMSEQEYVDACHFISEHIFYVYPENEHDVNSINERFRHLVLKKGVDGVMIDPFNQLDHIQKPYQREDQYLSETFKDLKRFALLNNVCYNIIAHPKNPTYEKDKSLPIVDMYDVAGGAMWGNKMDNIISYYRPNFHIDKNDPNVQVYIQKVKRKRTGGKQGDFPLILNWGRKRYMNPVSGEMPCNPDLTKRGEQLQTNILFSQQQTWKPYKDNDGETAGF